MPRWEVTWSVTEGTAADHYNVYLREENGPWVMQGGTPGNRFVLDVPNVLTRYQVGLAIVLNDIEATEDTWEILDFTPESDVDLVAPPDVPDFVVEQIDQSFDVRMRWRAVDRTNLAGYEVREGAAWETGLPRLFLPGDVPDNPQGWIEAAVGMLAPKSTTFQIKAMSPTGRYSDTAAQYTLDIQAPNTYRPETPTDEKSGGFAGTKDDTEVAGGDLRVAVVPSPASSWTSGVVTDYTKPIWLGHYGTGSYTTEVIEAQDDVGAGIVVDEIVTLDLEGQKQVPVTMTAARMTAIVRPTLSADVTVPNDPNVRGPYRYVFADGTVKYGNELDIEIRTAPDDPAGSPTWSAWRPFIPGARYRYRALQLRFTMTCRWEWVWLVTKMTITRWRRNLKDEVLVVDSTGSGGKAVTFTEPFTKKPIVEATVQGTAAAYATVANVTRTGCDVYIWDNGDPATQITGTVHVVAAGV